MSDGNNFSAGDDRRLGMGATAAIVLAPPGSEPLVLRGLASRSTWRVTVDSDPLAAMATLALAETGRLTRDAWELGERIEPGDEVAASRPPHIAFVLVRPSDWPEGRELLEAIAGYFPRIAIFTLDEYGLRSLSTPRPLVSAQRPADAANTQEPPAKREQLPSDGAITSEELDMLLDGNALHDGGRP